MALMFDYYKLLSILVSVTYGSQPAKRHGENDDKVCIHSRNKQKNSLITELALLKVCTFLYACHNKVIL
jgi:hypothetical protein